MGIEKQLDALNLSDILTDMAQVTRQEVTRVLQKDYLSHQDFCVLLSPVAKSMLEALAQRAHEQTIKQFGRTMGLYTPLYLGNYCENLCVYCGFNAESGTKRHVLSLEQAQEELNAIYQTGLRDVLLLTGESRKHTPVSYIAQVAKMAKRQFKSVGIEIYPLDEYDYSVLIETGVNSLTLYQETYDRHQYKALHIKGPKSDYTNRINGPERACKAGMAQVSMGALFGLSDPTTEAIKLYHHMAYIEKTFPHVELSLSLPRLREAKGLLPFDHYPISDRDFVHLLVAFRLAFPRLGINLSTRESALLRQRLLPLGVTKLSAGVKTSVGGHTASEQTEDQFHIADHRTLGQVVDMLKAQNYQAIFSDWVNP